MNLVPTIEVWRELPSQTRKIEHTAQRITTISMSKVFICRQRSYSRNVLLGHAEACVGICVVGGEWQALGNAHPIGQAVIAATFGDFVSA